MAYCLISGCNSSGYRKKFHGRDYGIENLSFCRVPAVIKNQGTEELNRSEHRQMLWLIAISRKDLTDDQLKNGRICGRHFVSGCAAPSWNRASIDWVPTLHLHNHKFDALEHSRKRVAKKKKKRLLQRQKKRSKVSDIERITDIQEENDVGMSDFNTNESYCMNDIISITPEIKYESPDDTGQLIDLLLQDIKQEPQTEENLTSSADSVCVMSKRSETDETCCSSDNNRCPVCNESCDTFDNLKSHIQLEHIDEDPQHCTDGSVEETRAISDHNYCIPSDQINETQPEHQQTKPADEEEHQCIQCEKSFTALNNLQAHMRQVHEEKKYSCGICEYSTSRKHHLIRHNGTVHEGSKLQKCRHCDYICFNKTTLAKHLSEVHDDLKSFECRECDQRFSRGNELDQHFRAVHCNENPFSCEHCDYKCSLKSGLMQHQQTVHEALKAFLCEKCGENFTRKESLKFHIKTIHREVYQCSECDKSFLRNSKLQRHFVTQHEGLKPFMCNKCGMSFKKKSQQKRHHQTCTYTSDILCTE